MIEPPRKKLVHYNDPGHAHCLTFSCDQRQHRIVDDRIRMLVIERLRDIRVALDYDLWAYVIMTNHVHLLVRPRKSTYSISSFLHSLKGPIGFHAIRALAIPGIRQFWQAGGGFDENINSAERALEMARYIHNNPVRKGIVQEPTDWRWSSARFWDGQKDFDLAMDDIR